MTNERKEAILDMAKKVVGTEINGITVEDVEFIEVPKNNGVKEGLSVKLSNRIAPTIYINGSEDNMEIFSLIEKAIESCTDKTPETMIGDINDRSRWRLSAVNLERCRENGYLKDHAYIECLDLAFIPTIVLSEEETIRLSEQALEAMGVSVSEFLEEAIKNTNLSIRTMREVLIKSMFPGGVDEDDPILQIMLPPDDGGLMVSQDPTGRFGTTLFVNEELLQKTKEEMGNFYIIPSSIYEVILVKADMTTPEDLRDMIGSVNESVLSPEDFLSSNAYYYDGKLQIAA